MESLPLSEWQDLYSELADRFLKERWKKDQPQMTFDAYKDYLKQLANNGIDSSEAARINRLASI